MRILFITATTAFLLYFTIDTWRIYLNLKKKRFIISSLVLGTLLILFLFGMLLNPAIASPLLLRVVLFVAATLLIVLIIFYPPWEKLGLFKKKL